MQKKKVLIIDDERLVRWSLAQKMTRWGYDVVEAESGAAGLRSLTEESPDILLLDMKLPDAKGTDVLESLRKNWPELPVIMITAFGVIEDVVTAMRRGAYDFITKPIDDAKLQSTVVHALEAAALKKKIAAYREIEKTKYAAGPIVGETPVMRQLLDVVKKLAESEASIILLQGESGTGKDLFAQTLHTWSRRSEASFLAINCSAIPANLLESELFGYEKGAFTDAKQQKRGLVELADEGTLFLDEISTLDIALQAKLLRFLETGTFKRVGGLRDVEVDLRVVAATNQDLEVLCRQEKFRKDLFYRLNVCPIYLPTLAERKDDILPLARHFIVHYNQKFNKAIQGLEPDAERLFLRYSWPGNVRELRNAIERAMIFEDSPLISPRHVPIRLSDPPPGETGTAPEPVVPEGLSLPEAEKRMVIQALEKSGGNKSLAARRLGISRDTLRYKLSKLKEEPAPKS
ncbi:MAG: sigma-54 dependent transcriptional regulator [Candidatus Aminicenantes bacterium]|nr:sigma-54 dependent transcriptional regulator [Candidatus Aminicenantes bacterium]